MNLVRHTICFCGLTLLVACSEEPPPVSVGEFMENPRLLEATMVRCGQNRSKSRYLADCINARDAVNRLEAAAEKTRREDLERQSERKRQALRRTQEAAAEARRRTLEAQRSQEEQEYLGIFDQAQGESGDAVSTGGVGNEATSGAASNAPGIVVEPPQATDQDQPPTEEIPPEPGTDLGAIREELKRRQESNN
jgi:hypothetical protein